ncbi:integrase, catalytic region, zinc finger, CCHC-type containing protein [Tanacetum coccineum]
MLLMQARENEAVLDEERILFITGGQTNTFDDDDVDKEPVQDLAVNKDNIFQADQYLIYDEVGLSYDLDILSEVQNHDIYHDLVCEHLEVHKMHNYVQPNYVVDSDAEYMNDSNMIPYDQYMKDNEGQVAAQYVSTNEQYKVVNASLTAELARYKEQVELYERRSKFELSECEQKIDEQLRIIITDRNIKKENLKMELPFVKMQLNSTINHNKSMPTLYNGHEIIKTHHVPAIVHDSEDTLEIAETTRKKMNMKMKDSVCVKTKVKIIPPEYSKENYLATFTPQKQLTPEQIFWSDDILKEKAKALKERANDPKPIIAMTVITPTGLTEGERGFEQAMECYLTNVIPFFKMLKEHFKGIQKALTKEVKEMKEIFEKMEAEVDQNSVDKKSAKIKRKNILIENENLIVDCLSKDVNNREVHLDYLKHLKESVETLREIVEEARVENTLDGSLASAYLYTKRSQELLEYVIGTCPKDFNKRDKKTDTTPLTRRKQVVQIILWLVRFGNDHFGAIMGYRDYVIGDTAISMVYYVEGIGHNLFSIGFSGFKSVQHSCLLSKASKNKSWLWHHRLNHLNFGTINDLTRKDLVRGLPRLKFEKDHLCSAYQLGKSKKKLDMAYLIYWIRHIGPPRYSVSDLLGSLDTAYWATLARIRRIFLMDMVYWSSE